MGMRDNLQDKPSYIEEARKQYLGLDTETADMTMNSVYEFKPDRMANMSKIAKQLRNAFLATLFLALVTFVTSPAAEATFGARITPPIDEDWIHLVLAAVALGYGGTPFFSATVRSFNKGTIDSAMLTSALVVLMFAYSLAATLVFDGETFYLALTIILVFSLLSRWLKVTTWSQLSLSVQSILDDIPISANVLREGSSTPLVIPSKNIVAGDVVILEAGERVPADGIIIEGEASVEQPLVVGAQGSVQKGIGNEVFAGSLVKNGSFKMRAERHGEHVLLVQVVNHAERAQYSMPKEQGLVDKTLVFFVPAVALIGLITFIFWGFVNGRGLDFAFAIAAATMAIAAPDTLALAVPVALAVGVEYTARRGIMIRDAAAMEKAARVNTVIFDEITPLAESKQAVSDIYHVGKLTELGFLRLAASLSKAANLRYAKALAEAVQAQVGRHIPIPEEIAIVVGCGAIGKVETRPVILGNRRLMADRGINIYPVEEKANELANQGKTIIYVAVDDRIEGIIAVENTIRADAKEMVDKLHDEGIGMVLLTGDDYKTANALAWKLGIDGVYAEVLPGVKVEKVKDMQRSEKLVCLVAADEGDQAALRQADLSIVLGTGPGFSNSQADIAIIKDDLSELVRALTLGNLVERKIRQNTYWAITYNILAIIIAAGVFYFDYGLRIRPESAAVLAALSLVVVVINSLIFRRQSAELTLGHG